MSDSRVNLLTKHLREYDKDLYAIRESSKGMIQVYRKATRPYYFEYEGVNFVALMSNPQYILALTDNWSLTGKPADWGVDQLLLRIRSIDSFNAGKKAEDLIKSYEASQARKDKQRQDDNEAWLRDNRNVFKNAFNEINTSNLNVKEKGFNYGNR